MENDSYLRFKHTHKDFEKILGKTVEELSSISTNQSQNHSQDLSSPHQSPSRNISAGSTPLKACPEVSPTPTPSGLRDGKPSRKFREVLSLLSL